ncbi:hypothetical protein [Pseudaquabacterium rugosum]|uniref:DUF3306 domain-containing protein n=1 Tax=Pseudaquabacterium rugosum TaxID=2984194 RepID=A0ABU9BFA5_9BURK
MTPAERAALALKAIPVAKPGAEPAADHARALAQPGHVLDLGAWPGDDAGRLDGVVEVSAEATASADAPIAVDSPADFSDRILQALFGRWPPAGADIDGDVTADAARKAKPPAADAPALAAPDRHRRD